MWEKVRASLARLREDDSARGENELRAAVRAAGCSLLSECQRGTEVAITGRIHAVTTRPLAGVPVLEVELRDGSGSLRVIWLGRRRIGGITSGRHLQVRGRLTHHEGRPTIFNASYELQPAE